MKWKEKEKSKPKKQKTKGMQRKDQPNQALKNNIRPFNKIKKI